MVIAGAVCCQTVGNASSDKLLNGVEVGERSCGEGKQRIIKVNQKEARASFLFNAAQDTGQANP